MKHHFVILVDLHLTYENVFTTIIINKQTSVMVLLRLTGIVPRH